MPGDCLVLDPASSPGKYFTSGGAGSILSWVVSLDPYLVLSYQIPQFDPHVRCAVGVKWPKIRISEKGLVEKIVRIKCRTAACFFPK